MSSSLAARTCAVVVTYNRADLLLQCLASLRAQTTPPAHLVVLDNASTDSTAEVLARESGIEVVRLAENGGASGGFAAAIAHAASQGWDWVWAMDDDVEARPDALEHLLAHAAPGVAALGSLKMGRDGQVQRFHAGDYHIGRMRIADIRATAGEPARATGYLSFVSLLIRGEVARAEVPNARLFIGHDDVEYALRLRRHGALVAVPKSIVLHHNEQASEKRRVLGRDVVRGGSWRVYYSMRNPLLIARLHGTRADRLLSAGVGAARLVGRLGAALLHHGGDVGRWWLAVRGYMDGLRGRTGCVVAPGDYR